MRDNCHERKACHCSWLLNFKSLTELPANSSLNYPLLGNTFVCNNTFKKLSALQSSYFILCKRSVSIYVSVRSVVCILCQIKFGVSVKIQIYFISIHTEEDWSTFPLQRCKNKFHYNSIEFHSMADLLIAKQINSTGICTTKINMRKTVESIGIEIFQDIFSFYISTIK